MKISGGQTEAGIVVGNASGHMQHWSRTGFVEWVGPCFSVVEVKDRFPCTLLLCRAKDTGGLPGG
jgi:hypothetical protein